LCGDTDLQFTIDGHKFEVNISLSKGIDESLLGSDWLIQNEAKWDFAARTVTLGDHMVHVYQRHHNGICRRILVTEDCVVPAKCKANILVKMVDEGIPLPSSN